MTIPHCKRFTGYKPCEPYKVCYNGCEEPVPYGTRIVIINLDALGTVLMTTAQLPAIKRKYPVSTLYWVTRPNAAPLLENNPYLDAVYEWTDENRMLLRAMAFEAVMNADKSRPACAFTMELKATRKLGFGLNENGAVIPLNDAAVYNYRLGLDDELKFRRNQRTASEILAETFELDYRRDEYVLNLREDEIEYCRTCQKEYGLEDGQPVIGFNTGCSNLYPNKKLTVEQHIELIGRLHAEFPEAHYLLLGGKEDTGRNQEIKDALGEVVISTPTTLGLRRGICFTNLCDVVVTGDSLGMHLAIALKKYVIAWFGVSCAAEIDLYGRGEKIVRALECSPCWKQVCDNPRGPICVTEFNLDEIVAAVGRACQRTRVRQEAMP